MERAGVKPNVVTYSALISACRHKVPPPTSLLPSSYRVCRNSGATLPEVCAGLEKPHALLT
eukprot:747696-Rhodomonas_salina.1